MPICKECQEYFETYKDLTKHLKEDHRFSAEQIYSYYNYSFETKEATCPICGSKFELSSRQIKRYLEGKSRGIACKKLCSMAFMNMIYGNPSSRPEVKEKKKETYRKHFGVDHISQLPEIKEKVNRKLEETNLKIRGVRRPIQSKESFEKMKRTNKERYDSEYSISSEKAREKAKSTNLERYGFENAYQNPEIQKKAKKRNLDKYGYEYASQSPEIKERIVEKNLEKYGVPYFCQHEKCSSANGFRISNPNRKFSKLLERYQIDNELEYIIENYGYDLRVGDVLIEINPYFTHNSTIGPCFGGKVREGKPYNYHLDKTTFAKEYGFKCIHIFDWDDQDKIVSLLKHRETLYARKCEVKEISKREVDDFLNAYHLQGTTKQCQYAYGLYYEGELVQVMTFGKPRYNKNYEYELLRLCSKAGISVVGGADKLLKQFEEQVKPSSIISYCDLSKFTGEVYEKLGFDLVSQTEPAKHWYNPKTRRHITDNLLRQRGYDQLHKASFGKGTSNEELMRNDGYVEIYDCGQLVFVKVLN